MSETCTVGETTVVDGAEYICAKVNTWYVRVQVAPSDIDVVGVLLQGVLLFSTIMLVASIIVKIYERESVK